MLTDIKITILKNNDSFEFPGRIINNQSTLMLRFHTEKYNEIAEKLKDLSYDNSVEEAFIIIEYNDRKFESYILHYNDSFIEFRIRKEIS